ncbi:hypothetical protein PVAND_008642 [Polypedilum vanderplanki]|uniref:tRNA-splicing endonuclease subunit Sen15 domain-containing protein n=1 Tax=Polypedilum vanderplanki TaxID=319348 RepID=A0A9J6CA77_POLVA|nr:hypothetical protein PVAND_008642 [Polypedilum vanderplanki]
MEFDNSISSDNDKKEIHQESTESDLNLEKFNSIKILNDIKSLGCKNFGLIGATYRAYMNLYEVCKYEDVSYHYFKELDIFYLEALKNKTDAEKEIIIPMIENCKNLTFKQIQKLQKTFKTNSIILAFCNSNALVTYYYLTKS